MAKAEIVAKQFVEVLIAPSFTAEAKAIFAAKQNVRLLEIALGNEVNQYDVKRVGGGLLVQHLMRKTFCRKNCALFQNCSQHHNKWRT
jgi:AICAR transformylase/IMP cyclohydrolase PurH